ncbi:hypothetical protein H3M12_09540 [Levilactobacillus suantsaii]|nr:hypothetical protein [Levilactobacillus suantsaii]QMU07698.1 hypothetical protein H3M12_09540 [Levilactobacillus suantsaii]
MMTIYSYNQLMLNDLAPYPMVDQLLQMVQLAPARDWDQSATTHAAPTH